jgi:hypothetical protein
MRFFDGCVHILGAHKREERVVIILTQRRLCGRTVVELAPLAAKNRSDAGGLVLLKTYRASNFVAML